MHSLADERIEDSGRHSNQCLTFTGLHLNDLAFVQTDSANNLHVEGSKADRAVRHFPHKSEHLDEQLL